MRTREHCYSLTSIQHTRTQTKSRWDASTSSLYPALAHNVQAHIFRFWTLPSTYYVARKKFESSIGPAACHRTLSSIVLQKFAGNVNLMTDTISKWLAQIHIHQQFSDQPSQFFDRHCRRRHRHQSSRQHSSKFQWLVLRQFKCIAFLLSFVANKMFKEWTTSLKSILKKQPRQRQKSVESEQHIDQTRWNWGWAI